MAKLTNTTDGSLKLSLSSLDIGSKTMSHISHMFNIFDLISIHNTHSTVDKDYIVWEIVGNFPVEMIEEICKRLKLDFENKIKIK